MHLEGNTIWLTVPELEEYGVPERTIRDGIYRNRQGKNTTSWVHKPDPQDSRRVLVQYETIPGRTRKAYQLPSQHELVCRAGRQAEDRRRAKEQQNKYELASSIAIKDEDYELLLQHYGSDEAWGRARLGAWLDFCMKAKANKMGFDGKEKLLTTVLSTMQREWEEGMLYGERITSIQVLRRRISRYKKQGAHSLLSGKRGLKNARKLTNTQANYVLVQYADPRKFTFEQVYDHYLAEAQKQGWQPVSIDTIKKYLRRPDIEQLWYFKRNGLQAWRNKYDPIIQRQRASFANALWELDGTPLELYYLENGKTRRRLYMFVVMDAHSRMAVGVALGTTETGELIRTALWNAAKHTGFLPHQIIADNSSAITGREKGAGRTIEKMCRTYTRAQAGNARSKTIEPFFKHLFNRVVRYFPNYSGSNITATHINSQPNPDLIRDITFPDRQTAEAQALAAFTAWNQSAPRGKDTPRAIYETSLQDTSEKQRLFTMRMEAELFWHQPEHRYLFTNQGIELTYQRERYLFDVENAKFRRNHIGDRFTIRYNPHEPNEIALYDVHGHPIINEVGQLITAKPKTKLSQAIVDKAEGEGKQYQYMQSLKDQQKTILEEDFAEAEQEIEDSGLKIAVSFQDRFKDTTNLIEQQYKEASLSSSGTKKEPQDYYADSLYGSDEDSNELREVS